MHCVDSAEARTIFKITNTCKELTKCLKVEVAVNLQGGVPVQVEVDAAGLGRQEGRWSKDGDVHTGVVVLRGQLAVHASRQT